MSQNLYNIRILQVIISGEGCRRLKILRTNKCLTGGEGEQNLIGIFFGGCYIRLWSDLCASGKPDFRRKTFLIAHQKHLNSFSSPFVSEMFKHTLKLLKLCSLHCSSATMSQLSIFFYFYLEKKHLILDNVTMFDNKQAFLIFFQNMLQRFLCRTTQTCQILFACILYTDADLHFIQVYSCKLQIHLAAVWNKYGNASELFRVCKSGLESMSD